jgi:hypothetical protein
MEQIRFIELACYAGAVRQVMQAVTFRPDVHQNKGMTLRFSPHQGSAVSSFTVSVLLDI